jgi:outer membrane receptor for Fe3+-dicitrate
MDDVRTKKNVTVEVGNSYGGKNCREFSVLRNFDVSDEHDRPDRSLSLITASPVKTSSLGANSSPANSVITRLSVRTVMNTVMNFRVP